MHRTDNHMRDQFCQEWQMPDDQCIPVPAVALPVERAGMVIGID
jgi:hypothetical protein